jgi:hypothetical protein
MAVFVDAADVGDAVARALEFGPRALAVAYIGAGAPRTLLSQLQPGDVVNCDASDLRLATNPEGAHVAQPAGAPSGSPQYVIHHSTSDRRPSRNCDVKRRA